MDPISAMPPTHAEMQAEREARDIATPRQVALVNDALTHVVGGAELVVPSTYNATARDRAMAERLLDTFEEAVWRVAETECRGPQRQLGPLRKQRAEARAALLAHYGLAEVHPNV